MSIWEFITNFKKNWFRIKLDFFFLSLNLIFTACVACKNQVRTRLEFEFVLNSIFFRVCNKLPNWHFKNQAQIDTVLVLYVFLSAPHFRFWSIHLLTTFTRWNWEMEKGEHKITEKFSLRSCHLLNLRFELLFSCFQT